jgi:Pentapeptide repeats (8 copies)
MVAESGTTRGWARFRGWPRAVQLLAWVLVTPGPIVLLAKARGRLRWWAASAFVVGVWLIAVVGLVRAPLTGRIARAMFTDRPRLWVAGGVLITVLALLWAVVGVLPRRLVSEAELTKEQVLKARNDVRSALFAALGGAVALSGAFTGGYVGLQQLKVNRQGQITERFTRAIDQLGQQALDVRVGAIYALERIARDSKEDHGPIMEILTTFVREHARAAPTTPAAPGTARSADSLESNRTPDTSCAKPLRPGLQADLQAALTVLGRRNPHYDKPGAHLDLEKVYIPGANLADLNLAHADLQEAILPAADLSQANMTGALLRGADLADAVLFEADLTGAELFVAHLTAANLSAARLTDAVLVGVNMTRTCLTGAHLAHAVLFGADLTGADLSGADLTGALLQRVRADRTTKWPEGFDPLAAGVDLK